MNSFASSPRRCSLLPLIGTAGPSVPGSERMRRAARAPKKRHARLSVQCFYFPFQNHGHYVFEMLLNIKRIFMFDENIQCKPGQRVTLGVPFNAMKVFLYLREEDSLLWTRLCLMLTHFRHLMFYLVSLPVSNDLFSREKVIKVRISDETVSAIFFFCEHLC